MVQAETAAAATLKKECDGSDAFPYVNLSQEPDGFDFEQAFRAVAAARKHCAVSQKEFLTRKPWIHLEFQAFKIRINAPGLDYAYITVPHPVYSSKTKRCVIVPDLYDVSKRDSDREKTSRTYQEYFASHNITGYDVLSVQQIMTEYSTFESRRMLCNYYDVVYADYRIISKVTAFLGKTFISAKMQPHVIDLLREDVEEEFKRASCTTRMVLNQSSISSSVKIGSVTDSLEHLCDNLRAVVKAVAVQYDGQWPNIREVHLTCGNEPLRLPLYVSWESPNNINLPPYPNIRETFVEGDLSTLDYEDSRVRVFEDGFIDVAANKSSYDPNRKRKPFPKQGLSYHHDPDTKKPRSRAVAGKNGAGVKK